jgi:hypothetical protein
MLVASKSFTAAFVLGLLCLASGASEAGFIQYTATITATGSLGGTGFSNSPVTITGIGDTNNVVNASPLFTNLLTSVTVTVAGVGSGTPGTVTWPKAGPSWAGEIQLVIRSSHPTNPVRNIQFLLPGADGQKFYDGFLANVAPFDTLPFMDWGRCYRKPKDRGGLVSVVTVRGVPRRASRCPA